VPCSGHRQRLHFFDRKIFFSDNEYRTNKYNQGEDVMAKVLEKQEIIQSLKNLAQLDIDAYHAYGQAIEEIEEHAIRERLLVFQEDHRTHYLNLSEKITDLGGTPPEFSKDFKGYLLGGFTAIRSKTGTKGAIAAMQSNEQTTNKNYRQALEPELPRDIRELLELNYNDEKRHLAYVEEQLKLLKS
jgi:rubrerythrin